MDKAVYKALIQLVISFAICVGLAISAITYADTPSRLTETKMASLDANTLIDPDELYFLLPDDADQKNYKRQIKAVKKGLYWSTANRVKPLKGELRELVEKFYN